MIFKAMLIDAYRELNSKKLFWVILALSMVFVIVYASIGFDDTGVSMLFGVWHIDNEMLTRDSRLSVILYRGIFSTFVIPIWLSWIATILALISTTTIFPDFVSGGAIDVMLSKPISRVRLFAYKYFSSLLFVVLQIGVFCIGVFLCMGLRLNDWEWRLFIAIPIVTVFYSYLFSVNVLIGVWTRSAITALLLTLLLWFGLYAINQTEAIINMVHTSAVVEVERSTTRIAALEDSTSDSSDDDMAGPSVTLEMELSTARDARDEAQKTIDTLKPYRFTVRAFQSVFPKTGETIGVVDRLLSRDDDINLMDILSGNVEQSRNGDFQVASTGDDRQVQQRMMDEYNNRSLWYVIGTSLIFEFVVLGLACWIFVRRDY
jgi:ABC-type transport system involved in multi-copper enzyme maturation permease subunit